MAEPILEVDGLQAWYGESHVLHEVNLTVYSGEVVTLLGRNGVGKTTTLKSICGMLRKKQGVIRFAGRDVSSAPSNHIARLGMGYVPEERGIFTTLTVEENLMLPPALGTPGSEPFSVAEIYRLFPNLLERRRSSGGKLSGGEQQMLAIARILRIGPRLLVLDEPTEGLAPVIVQRIGELIRMVNARGTTVLLVEQNFIFTQKLSHRYYVMDEGRIVESFGMGELASRADALHNLLGV